MNTILYIKISYFKYSIKSLDITGKSEMRMNLVLIIHKNQFLGIWSSPSRKLYLNCGLDIFSLGTTLSTKIKAKT